jgi:glycosyltransferase involved in cell wall biosynthesis
MLADSRSVHIKRWARSLVERGVRLTLISLAGHDIENVEVINLPVTGNRRLGYLRRAGAVRKLIDKIKPDLVHAHYASSFGYWGMRSGFHPFLLSVWGTDVVEFPTNVFSRMYLERILNRADAIAATSEFLKTAARKFVKNDRRQISVIPFGVDLSTPVDKPDGPDGIRLIFTKVHHERYGPDVLLHALKTVLEKVPGMTLTMAGVGPMTASLKSLAADLGIKDKVDFPGFVDYRKIPEVMARHDILVMPSLHEGFGVAALEAGAAGLPTIATEVGGIPEVVIDGQTGLLVPPNDISALAEAIIRLSEDAGLRREFGQNARIFVEKRYNWDDCVDQMIALYESLV